MHRIKQALSCVGITIFIWTISRFIPALICKIIGITSVFNLLAYIILLPIGWYLACSISKKKHPQCIRANLYVLAFIESTGILTVITTLFQNLSFYTGQYSTDIYGVPYSDYFSSYGILLILEILYVVICFVLVKNTLVTEAPEIIKMAINTVSSDTPHPVNSSPTVKQRYCKLCGGAIDIPSKKCTKCGKQYFHVKRLIKPLCILWALFTVCLLISVMFISRFACQQTEKLHETEQLLNAQLASEEKYWTGYCEGNDVGYRNGYYTGIHEVLTEKQIFSRLYSQYQNAILDKSTLLDYDTWLEEQIGLYMSGYNDGFKTGQNDYTNGHSFSKSYGGHGRSNDRMNVSYIAGRVDGYNDGYANAAYPNN